MKLTEELKQRIDSYFEKVTPKELYRISTIKYGFEEDLSLEVKDEPFTHVDVETYIQNAGYSTDPNLPTDPMPHAA